MCKILIVHPEESNYVFATLLSHGIDVVFGRRGAGGDELLIRKPHYRRAMDLL